MSLELLKNTIKNLSYWTRKMKTLAQLKLINSIRFTRPQGQKVVKDEGAYTENDERASVIVNGAKPRRTRHGVNIASTSALDYFAQGKFSVYIFSQTEWVFRVFGGFRVVAIASEYFSPVDFAEVQKIDTWRVPRPYRSRLVRRVEATEKRERERNSGSPRAVPRDISGAIASTLEDNTSPVSADTKRQLSSYPSVSVSLALPLSLVKGPSWPRIGRTTCPVCSAGCSCSRHAAPRSSPWSMVLRTEMHVPGGITVTTKIPHED